MDASRRDRVGRVGGELPTDTGIPPSKYHVLRVTLFRRRANQAVSKWADVSPGATLEFDDLVIETVGIDRLVELVEQVETVARQEVYASDGTLLQALVGIERLA